MPTTAHAHAGRRRAPLVIIALAALVLLSGPVTPTRAADADTRPDLQQLRERLRERQEQRQAEREPDARVRIEIRNNVFGANRAGDGRVGPGDADKARHPNALTYEDTRDLIARAMTERRRTTDAVRFGKPAANPFAKLDDAGVAALKSRGLDVERLRRMKAVAITGSFAGANSTDFVSRDPNVILVFGAGFFTHGNVYSAGPVLATNDAHFMGDVYTMSVAWFIDDANPRGQTAGFPVILSPSAGFSQIDLRVRRVWRGWYGWPVRQVDRFGRPLSRDRTAPAAANAPAEPLLNAEPLLDNPDGRGAPGHPDAAPPAPRARPAVRTRPLPQPVDPLPAAEVAAMVRQADTLVGRGHAASYIDASEWGVDAPNPFATLDPQAVEQLAQLGVDVARLAKMKARRVTGSYGGANAITLVNPHPDVILILADSFASHGEVYSAGPVVTDGDDVYPMRPVYGAALTWFTAGASAADAVTGYPLLVDPSIHTLRKLRTNDAKRAPFTWTPPQ